MTGYIMIGKSGSSTRVKLGNANTGLSLLRTLLTVILQRTWTILWLLQNVINTDLGITIKSRCSHYHMDESPLPCTKQLWEATSKREWEHLYHSYLASRRSRGTIKTGDLRSTQRLGGAGDTPVKEFLKEDLISWSLNVDSLGALLLVHVR
jgi:hypothetical protein